MRDYKISRGGMKQHNRDFWGKNRVKVRNEREKKNSAGSVPKKGSGQEYMFCKAVCSL